MEVRQRPLPRDGVIPGARGHKKIIVPKGTAVWVIEHRFLLFRCVYLNKEQADTCLKGLQDTVEGRTRRPMTLQTLLDWNFKQEFPTRVARPKS